MDFEHMEAVRTLIDYSRDHPCTHTDEQSQADAADATQAANLLGCYLDDEVN